VGGNDGKLTNGGRTALAGGWGAERFFGVYDFESVIINFEINKCVEISNSSSNLKLKKLCTNAGVYLEGETHVAFAVCAQIHKSCEWLRRGESDGKPVGKGGEWRNGEPHTWVGLLEPLRQLFVQKDARLLSRAGESLGTKSRFGIHPQEFLDTSQRLTESPMHTRDFKSAVQWFALFHGGVSVPFVTILSFCIPIFSFPLFPFTLQEPPLLL